MKQQHKTPARPHPRHKDEPDYDTLLQMSLEADAECEQLRQENAGLRLKADFYDQVCRIRKRISGKAP